MSGQNQSANLSGSALLKLAAFREMASEHVKRVGEAIRQRREEIGLSKAAFARAVHSDPRTVTRWEHGDTAGAITALDEIAVPLKTTADELLARAAGLKRDQDLQAPSSVSDSERLDRMERMLGALLEANGVTALADPDVQAEAEGAAQDAEAAARATEQDGRQSSDRQPPTENERRAG